MEIVEAKKAQENNLRQLEMKEWFANKVANEIKHNLFNTEIFAVLRETEKALYCMLNVTKGCYRCVWIPKSCVTEHKGSIENHTWFGLTYEQALEEAKWFWFGY